MGVEDILLQAAADVENEYDDEFDDFENEARGESLMASLKKAAQVVDKEDEFDARDSLLSESRVQKQKPANVASSPRRQDRDHDIQSVEEMLKKADEKINGNETENFEEKMEDTESEAASEDDEDDEEYAESRDFLNCCVHGREEEVLRHMKRGASLRARDRHGWSPVHWASARGHAEVLTLLLNEGRGGVKKCLNGRDGLAGFTPLHVACVRGHAACVRVLLDHGAKKLKNDLGELPIDVMGISLSSVEGRKIGKMFGVTLADELDGAEAKQSANLRNGSRSKK